MRDQLCDVLEAIFNLILHLIDQNDEKAKVLVEDVQNKLAKLRKPI